ncbi:MAG: hypothetical protein M3020_11305, partial [Myxococcota bacterium]|nr:hypothetical protein [Myxococcota bacterium]
MKTFSLVLSSMVVFGCAAPSQSTAIAPSSRHGALGSGQSNALIAQGSAAAAAFTPRPHAPHPRPVATFADLSRLPAMRRGSCYAESSADLPRPSSTRKGRAAASTTPPRPAPVTQPGVGQGYGYSFGGTAAEAAPAGPPA